MRGRDVCLDVPEIRTGRVASWRRTARARAQRDVERLARELGATSNGSRALSALNASGFARSRRDVERLARERGVERERALNGANAGMRVSRVWSHRDSAVPVVRQPLGFMR